MVVYKVILCIKLDIHVYLHTHLNTTIVYCMYITAFGLWKSQKAIFPCMYANLVHDIPPSHAY